MRVSDKIDQCADAVLRPARLMFSRSRPIRRAGATSTNSSDLRSASTPSAWALYPVAGDRLDIFRGCFTRVVLRSRTEPTMVLISWCRRSPGGVMCSGCFHHPLRRRGNVPLPWHPISPLPESVKWLRLRVPDGRRRSSPPKARNDPASIPMQVWQIVRTEGGGAVTNRRIFLADWQCPLRGAVPPC